MTQKKINALANHVLDYVTAHGPTRVSVISAELVREFDLRDHLEPSGWQRVMRAAKDLGHDRSPPVAFLPQNDNGRFRGYWTVEPLIKDALPHATMQIKQVAARAERDGRSYLLLDDDSNEEFTRRRKAVRAFMLTAQIVTDDLFGIERSEAFQNARLAEMMRIAAELS